MYYLVYKTTNNVNGKTYIGVHKTGDINDGYIGSGKLLKKAIKKYGIKNFSKEILACFDNAADMYFNESLLVTEDFVKANDNYNLKIGGTGGFDYINQHKLNYSNRPIEWKRNHSKEMTRKKRKIHSSAFLRKIAIKNLETIRERGIVPSRFTGKRHTDDAKRKIGEANSKRQKGRKNSNYGCCWIYSVKLQKSKSIVVADLPKYLQNGWVKGRRIKWN